MKTNSKITLLAALGLALTGIYAHAQPEHSPEAGPTGPLHMRFGQVLQGVINQYDTNQDGQLDSTEMAALQKDIAEGKITPPAGGAGGPRGFGPGRQAHVPQAILDQYDTNKDGNLDETERAVLRQDIKDGKLALPEGGLGPRGPMAPSLNAKQILERFDNDKDGKLDETELKAFLDSRPSPPMRHAGGPPFGHRPQPEPPQN